MSEITGVMNAPPLSVDSYMVTVNDSDNSGESDNVDIVLPGPQGHQYEVVVEAGFDEAHQRYQWGEGTSVAFYDNAPGSHQMLGSYRLDANGKAMAQFMPNGQKNELPSVLMRDEKQGDLQQISQFQFPDGTMARIATPRGLDGAGSPHGVLLSVKHGDGDLPTGRFSSEGAQFTTLGDPSPLRHFETWNRDGELRAWSSFDGPGSALAPETAPALDAGVPKDLKSVTRFVLDLFKGASN
jgi:hypothetical protein